MAEQSCFYVTLGCAKNEVDTNRMKALMQGVGFAATTSIDECDVIIINTCSFLSVATQESLEATLELAGIRDANETHAPIVMCGCVPSRYGDELAEELPEVAAFVPADEEDSIADIVLSLLGVESRESDEPSDVLRTVEGASAYVKISDGCDRFCTFCAIPYIRGRYASRDAEEILSEVRMLMGGGVREIVLIGQDTGIWGQDLPGNHDLAWLLEQVAITVRPYGGWVRVLYLQPEGMTERLVTTIRDVPEVLPYIDIPIQHCNASILRRMGRSGSEPELAKLFKRLRTAIPGMVLRSTGLVGFPGETDEEFEQLVRFVEDVEFDYTSVFAYSVEEGTAAAKMGGQVDEDVKLDRTQRLTDVAEALGFAATASHVGETVDVIIDGIEQTDSGYELIGHAWFQAPDCDGAIHIAEGEAAVGEVVRCVLVDSFCYELQGEVVRDGEV